MLKLSAPLAGLVMFCTSLSLYAAPAPIGSLTGQTFIVKGEAFQAKLSIDADGLGKIWRPDGYSTIKWIQQGDLLVATLDNPLESPYESADAEGNPVTGVSKLEVLKFAFADGQKLIADVKETVRETFPAGSGLPEVVEELDNAALPFVNYKSLQPLPVSTGSLLALPLSGDQSAIIKISDASNAVLVEDPLNKAPSNFTWNSTDSLTLSLSATSSIRYTIVEGQGLSSVLLGEVKADGKESIFLSAGGTVDQAVYAKPATAAEFAGQYTIPEFADTNYIFASDGSAKIVSKAADGTVTEGILTWGENAGLIFGNRWTQTINDEVIPVADTNLAKACQAGTEVCDISQARTYKFLAKSATQLLVLRVLDQKVENGVTSWIHVFNRVNR